MAAASPSPHRPAIEALGLGEPASGRLCLYLDTLAAWSARVNLTGARSPAERAQRLVAEVLAGVPLPAPGRLIDVGSGNGSPGLVFAILRQDLEVTLLEPRARRWAFLREAARAADASVRVERARHDQYAGPPAATLTLRALALPLGELAPLLDEGGRILVLGGRPVASPPFVLERELPGVPGGARLFARRAVPRET